jgi:hypothetical protein
MKVKLFGDGTVTPNESVSNNIWDGKHRKPSPGLHPPYPQTRKYPSMELHTGSWTDPHHTGSEEIS